MLRCGVIGFGLAGRIFHCAVIAAVEGLTLAGILERSGNSAAAAYPGTPVFRSAEAMLAEAEIDVAVIATPNDTHAALARQCLHAGKHVVIDKPFTTTSAEAAELIELGRAKERIVAAYHNRRWDGDFLTLRRLIASGALGRVVAFESHFDRFRPQRKPRAWRESERPGAGILFDLGPHLIDQALVLFGAPEAIFADIRAERPGGRADDAFDLRLFYPEVAVWLRASCLATLPAVRFLAHGTKASYRKFGLDPQEDALRAGDLFRSEPWGVESESAWGALISATESGAVETRPVPTEAGDYREFYRNLRDAVAGRAPLAVAPVDAWRTVRLVELAAESSRTRRVIPCDWSSAPS